MAVIGEILKSQLRKQMKRRTEEILKAVRKVERSQNDLTHAIEKWCALMEKIMEELKE